MMTSIVLLSKIWHIFREAMIPCILLAVGGNLVDGKNLFSFETVVKLYYTDITRTIAIVCEEMRFSRS